MVQRNRRVSIVIPIYNARAFTERCIATVREHARGDWRLILVNDRSTDQELCANLRALPAEDSRIQLIENPVNRGFVATANVGMRASGEDDVLLLNSDTEVFEGFVERLTAAAHADDRTGVVSPFSNNATLCSIPIPFQDNPIPAGFTPAEMNRLVASCSMRERPEIPTAVGFCMFIRHEVFRDAEFFDEDTYGRGFGEENDFCELAKEAGWKVRLADDVFVYHSGKASFGDEGRELERRNLAILEERHPGYLRTIAHFIAEDPLRSLHDRIRLQLRRDRGARTAAMLFVLHASPYAHTPGGTEFHVRDLVRTLRLPRAVIAYPEGEWLVAAEVIDGAVDSPLLYRFPLRHRPERFLLEDSDVERLLRRLLRFFSVTAAHVHHLMYWPISVARVFRDAGIPCAYTLHDYFAVCPNWNLFDAGAGGPCPCDDSARCERSCLPLFFEKEESHKPREGLSFILLRNRHRAAFAEALGSASLVVFPSNTARDEIRRFHRVDANICRVIEHGYAAPPVRESLPELPPAHARLRLLVLGEVAAPVKGAANYLALIDLTRNVPVEWHFIGRSPQQHFEHKLAEQGLLDRVRFHGRIDRGQLFERIATIAPDAGVLLPACHETFSYVFSEMLLAGLPVLVNDLGAPGERTRSLGVGWVASSLEEAAEKLRELSREPDLLREMARRVHASHHVTLEENAAAHRTAYAGAGLLSRVDRPAVTSPLDLAALATSWIEARPTAARQESTETRAAVVDPAYQKARWYRPFLKVKPLIPGSLRRAGRDVLLRYQYKTWRVLHADRHGQVNGLSLLKRGLNEATWAINAPDARIVFALDPVPIRSVKLIRFRLRRESEKEAFAQIFWTHSPDAAFDATRSVRVNLDSRTGEWREYLLRLDAPYLAQAWRAGEHVYGLRFDPSSVPGVISLGPIELGG